MDERESNLKLYWVLFLAGLIPFLLNGFINSKIQSIPILYWSFEILIWTIVPVVVFYLAVKYASFRFSEIGINTNIFGRKSTFLVLAFCLIFPPITYVIYGLSINYSLSVFPGGALFSYFDVIPKEGITRFIVILYFALSAGIVEELYYRGFIYKISQFYASPKLFYLTVSPVFFSMVHWENGVANIVATYIFGVILAIIFLSMKNLWPLITGHIFTDYVWFS